LYWICLALCGELYYLFYRMNFWYYYICVSSVPWAFLFCRETMDMEESTRLIRKSEVAALEDSFLVELKRVWSMAAPMVAATASQNALEVVSLMMVGHLGILVSFSGVAIATSFAEVTGFCVIVNSSFIFFHLQWYFW